MATVVDQLKPVLEPLAATQTAQAADIAALKATVAEQATVIKAFRASPDYSRVAATARDPEDEGKFGYKNFSHYCRDVYLAEVRPEGREPSPVFKSYQGIVTKAASGMNETVGSEGGYTVPPTFASEILKRTYENDLLSRTRDYQATGNDMTFPAIDETSRADGSRFGGVRAYWESEAAQYTATKPAYNMLNLKLKKLIALCHATDELLNDSGIAIEQHLFDLFAQEMAFKMGDAIVNGTGAGQPQGILNCPAFVSVSKETGQAAASLLYENINKMWQRMYAPSRANAVWLINQDIEAAMEGLAVNVGTGGLPAYLPPGGLSDKPYATLKGRPVMPQEFCATLGTVGDILLVDLSQYITLRKGDVQQATSIHFKFDTGEQSFRVTARMDGKCWWTAPLTQYKSSNTQSPLIGLATRA